MPFFLSFLPISRGQTYGLKPIARLTNLAPPSSIMSNFLLLRLFGEIEGLPPSLLRSRVASEQKTDRRDALPSLRPFDLLFLAVRFVEAGGKIRVGRFKGMFNVLK